MIQSHVAIMKILLIGLSISGVGTFSGRRGYKIYDLPSSFSPWLYDMILSKIMHMYYFEYVSLS